MSAKRRLAFEQPRPFMQVDGGCVRIQILMKEKDDGNMPILDVEIVTHPNENSRPDLVTELANQAGEIFHSPPGNTWVKIRFIARENYAENSNGSGDIFPVFVSVLKARMPSPEALQAEVTELTVVIARVCNRPQENVHILYLPEGAGRVAFGGKVLSG